MVQMIRSQGRLLLGILNTVLTESVMEATDLPRSVASSSYSAEPVSP